MATLESPGDAWKESSLDATARKIQEDVDKAELVTVERHNSLRALGKDVEDAAHRAAAGARLEQALAQYDGNAVPRSSTVRKSCSMCQGSGKARGWFGHPTTCWKCKGSGDELHPGT